VDAVEDMIQSTTAFELAENGWRWDGLALWLSAIRRKHPDGETIDGEINWE
jgi:hypothetical protein